MPPVGLAFSISVQDMGTLRPASPPSLQSTLPKPYHTHPTTAPEGSTYPSVIPKALQGSCPHLGPPQSLLASLHLCASQLINKTQLRHCSPESLGGLPLTSRKDRAPLEQYSEHSKISIAIIRALSTLHSGSTHYKPVPNTSCPLHLCSPVIMKPI